MDDNDVTAWRPQTGERAATSLARRRVMLRLATATTAGYRRWRRGRGERVGQPPRQRQERLLRLPALGAGAGPRRLADLGNQPAGFCLVGLVGYMVSIRSIRIEGMSGLP